MSEVMDGGNAWTRYDGKGRPFPNGTPLEIQQRDGKERRGTHWSETTWSWSTAWPEEDVMFYRQVQAFAFASLKEQIDYILQNAVSEDDYAKGAHRFFQESDPYGDRASAVDAIVLAISSARQDG